LHSAYGSSLPSLTTSEEMNRAVRSYEMDSMTRSVNAGGYLAALARHELSRHLNYPERSHIENDFRPTLCESTALTRFD
jgi:hypothetical protein